MSVVRIPLAATISEREPGDPSDTLLKNCHKESVKDGEGEEGKTIFVTKRWGLAANDTTAVAAGRGIHCWEGNIYAVVGNTVYKNGAAIAGTLNTATGRVRFDEAADGTGLLVFHDGVDIYTVDSADTLTTLADIDIPPAMVSGLVVLDQYLFVLTPLGQVFNSIVGDITDWQGDFLTAELRSDPGVAIARYINYIVVFGQDTTELFFDANNLNGSPLNRFEGMATLIGCAAGESVVQFDQSIIWAARTAQGGRFIAMMKQGFQVDKLSTQAIDEILEKEGASLSDAYAFHIRRGGKNFYVLTLPTVAGRTFVADLDEMDWYEWTSDTSGAETYWTPVDSAGGEGITYLLDEDNGEIYTFDPEVYQDTVNSIAEDIIVAIRTKKGDQDTTQNKFMSRLRPIGDLTPNSATIGISWTDDDYKTFTTPRTVDLVTDQTWLTRCGMYKRRAYTLDFVQNEPLRLSHLEANIVTGHYARS